MTDAEACRESLLHSDPPTERVQEHDTEHLPARVVCSVGEPPATRHTAEEIAGKQNGRVDLSVGDDGWIDLDGGRMRLPAAGDRVQERTFGVVSDGHLR